MKTDTLPPIKVDSSRWLVPEINIPIKEPESEDFDTPESIQDFERFQGLFPYKQLPSNYEEWAESHIEVALKDYQEFLELKFEYLGHTFKPAFSEEANDNRFPFPFSPDPEPGFYPYPIEGWNSSDFETSAPESCWNEIYAYLMDDEIYIVNGLDYPHQLK
ncbi:MAG: hypothetical protein AB4041_08715 [Microcystaceae cyanobacterium]